MTWGEHEENAPPEFLLWDEGEDNEEKEDAPLPRGKIMYHLGTEIVLGDDAAHGTTVFD